jgi:hypothetical protein
MDIFGDLERFAADLYPYRWPISIGLGLALAALIAVAIRGRWHEAAARHWVLTLAIAVPVVVVAAPVGWYTLSPLWQRSYLEEASPLAAAPLPTASPVVPGGSPSVESDASPIAPTVSASLPRQTHLGMFEGADEFHFGRGTAQLIETEPGVYTLRFEEFSVRNGPDLFVYLTPDPSGESIEGAVNLGELKATDGAFNYEIPAGTDISAFKSAIVWCRQFATLFAVAELMDV